MDLEKKEVMQMNLKKPVASCGGLSSVLSEGIICLNKTIFLK